MRAYTEPLNRPSAAGSALPLALVVLGLLLAPGCTERNPAYRGDLGAVGDGSSSVDRNTAPRDTGPKPDTRSGACPPGEVLCGTACVNLNTDRDNCGACGKRCPSGQRCSGGICCPTGQINCNGACVDIQRDPAHCGGCGKACKPGESCQSGQCAGATSPCADGKAEQTFDNGMYGCGGRVRFAGRALLCGTGYRPCHAAEWVSFRGGRRPTYNYWTDDNLRYRGYYERYCYVTLTGGTECDGGSNPMRVCASKKDDYDNRCNWTNCGFNQHNPNQYFGGCEGNTTAGTLCCRD